MAMPIIPEGPWTVEKLGSEQYNELSVAFGCGVDSSFRPALDLTLAYAKQQADADSKKTEAQQSASKNEGGK